MKFQKGNNLGGRTPGAKNKTTETIRNAFNELLENNLSTLQKDLDSLEPKDRLKFIIDLSAFVIPKLKATEIVLGESRTINIKPIEWVD